MAFKDESGIILALVIIPIVSLIVLIIAFIMCARGRKRKKDHAKLESEPEEAKKFITPQQNNDSEKQDADKDTDKYSPLINESTAEPDPVAVGTTSAKTDTVAASLTIDTETASSDKPSDFSATAKIKDEPTPLLKTDAQIPDLPKVDADASLPKADVEVTLVTPPKTAAVTIGTSPSAISAVTGKSGLKFTSPKESGVTTGKPDGGLVSPGGIVTNVTSVETKTSSVTSEKLETKGIFVETSSKVFSDESRVGATSSKTVTIGSFSETKTKVASPAGTEATPIESTVTVSSVIVETESVPGRSETKVTAVESKPKLELERTKTEPTPVTFQAEVPSTGFANEVALGKSETKLTNGENIEITSGEDIGKEIFNGTKNNISLIKSKGEVQVEVNDKKPVFANSDTDITVDYITSKANAAPLKIETEIPTGETETLSTNVDSETNFRPETLDISSGSEHKVAKAETELRVSIDPNVTIKETPAGNRAELTTVKSTRIPTLARVGPSESDTTEAQESAIKAEADVKPPKTTKIPTTVKTLPASAAAESVVSPVKTDAEVTPTAKTSKIPSFARSVSVENKAKTEASVAQGKSENAAGSTTKIPRIPSLSKTSQSPAQVKIVAPTGKATVKVGASKIPSPTKTVLVETSLEPDATEDSATSDAQISSPTTESAPGISVGSKIPPPKTVTRIPARSGPGLTSPRSETAPVVKGTKIPTPGRFIPTVTASSTKEEVSEPHPEQDDENVDDTDAQSLEPPSKAEVVVSPTKPSKIPSLYKPTPVGKPSPKGQDKPSQLPKPKPVGQKGGQKDQPLRTSKLIQPSKYNVDRRKEPPVSPE